MNKLFLLPSARGGYEKQIIEPLGFEKLPIKNITSYRIFAFIISNIWIQNGLEKDIFYELSIQDYADTFKIHRDNALKTLKKELSAMRLFETPVEELNEVLNLPDEMRMPGSRIFFSAFHAIDITADNRLFIQFHPYLCYLYNKISEGTLSYYKSPLKNIHQTSSLRLVKFIRLIERNSFVGSFQISLEEFKTLIVEGDYKEFKILNRDILQPLIKEANKVMKTKISCEFIKQGKKVTDLKFTKSK